MYLFNKNNLVVSCYISTTFFQGQTLVLSVGVYLDTCNYNNKYALRC